MRKFLFLFCLASIACSSAPKVHRILPAPCSDTLYMLSETGASIEVPDASWRVYERTDGSYLVWHEEGLIGIRITVDHDQYTRRDIDELAESRAMRVGRVGKLGYTPSDYTFDLAEEGPRSGRYFSYLSFSKDGGWESKLEAFVTYGDTHAGRLILLTGTTDSRHADMLMDAVEHIAKTIRLY